MLSRKCAYGAQLPKILDSLDYLRQEGCANCDTLKKNTPVDFQRVTSVLLKSDEVRSNCHYGADDVTANARTVYAES